MRTKPRTSTFPRPGVARWMTHQRKMRWHYARRPEERARRDDAVKRLGSALGDPTTGLAALSRVGVSFGTGHVRGRWTMARIRFWRWIGNPRRAQRIILNQLRQEIGI